MCIGMHGLQLWDFCWICIGAYSTGSCHHHVAYCRKRVKEVCQGHSFDIERIPIHLWEYELYSSYCKGESHTFVNVCSDALRMEWEISKASLNQETINVPVWSGVNPSPPATIQGDDGKWNTNVFSSFCSVNLSEVTATVQTLTLGILPLSRCPWIRG